MDNKTLFTLVAFSATDLIGEARLKKIKQHFTNIYDFLDCDTEFQFNFLGLKTEKTKNILLNMKKNAEIILEKCDKQNISLISYDDHLYPKLLKDISEPPYLLYVKGNFYPQIPMVAVIGTRKASREAIDINRWFCKHFVEYGLGVVSGVAFGHDSIAAQTVLDNEGFTVGVLGTAIDIVYPSHATRLFDRIKEHGALISEYPPGMVSTKWRFPRRNRIVSGMSQAVLVVQAPEKSGTMITVQMALEQHKDVFVVPGNPMNPLYKGSNSMIQKGTKIALDPIETVHDILKSAPNIETIKFLSQHNMKNKQTEYQIDKSLSIEEQKILELSARDIHFDELHQELGINTSSLTSLLTIMEIKELIIQKPGQLYIRKEEI